MGAQGKASRNQTRSLHHGSYEGNEVDESRCKSHDQGSIHSSPCCQHEMKTKQVAGIINSLVSVATTEVKKNGIFTIPGLCRIKTRVKPATKAGKKNIFGKEVVVKAKPAKTIVKAYPVAALKSQI